MKKQMLQNALDNVDDFHNICTVGQQMGKSTTFEDYKTLVHATTDAYGKKGGAKKCATHNACSHDLDVYNPVGYIYERYDLDTNIDMIYANAANTREGMIQYLPTISIRWHQKVIRYGYLYLPKTASSFSIKTRLPLLLPQIALGMCMDKVAVVDAEPSPNKGINPTTKFVSIFMIMSQLTWHLLQSTTETSLFTDPDDSNIVDNICDYFDTVFDTLYAHVANHHTEENKKKHNHWKPPKLSSLPPADVWCMLANNKDIHVNGVKYDVKKANSAVLPTDIVIKDITYEVSMARLLSASGTPDLSVPTYHVSALQLSWKTRALIDHGANGGIAGADCRMVEQDDMPKPTRRYDNIKGINNHVMEWRPIVTAGAMAHSNHGLVILIMHEFAHMEKGTSILSSAQMEWYKVEVDDTSIKVGGKQQVTMLDGFVIPLDIRHGLAYLDMHPFMDQEWNELSHVILTHENIWDPRVLDHKKSKDQDWLVWSYPRYSIALSTIWWARRPETSYQGPTSCYHSDDQW